METQAETASRQRCNVPNRTIFCHDNLEILRGINSECVDLVYLDPPFNKKKVFIAPTGTSAEGASFSDIFTQEDVKDEWIRTIKEDYYAIHELLNAVKNIENRTSYNYCYLCYMAIRLIECHRVLKDTGSVYLHCDPTMSHYLKLLLDCIFGESNFKNNLIWDYKKISNTKGNKYNRRHDDILFYSKSKTYTFNHQYTGISDRKKQLIYAGFNTKNMNGEKYIYIYDENKVKEKNIDLSKYDKVQYVDAATGTLQSDILNIDNTNSQASEYVGYPTQKPLALLERIVQASSNEGDLVLDPFCGCATTCVAAEKWGRSWIGIDISIKAYELVQTRIKDELYEAGLLKSADGYLPDIHCRTSPPRRTDSGAQQSDRKYVYVISHPNYEGEYKVGIASNVKSRLNSYQTSDPNRAYKLEYHLLTERYRELERRIHDKFENKHEWVRADKQSIIDEMEKHRSNGAEGLGEEGLREEGLFDAAERN